MRDGDLLRVRIDTVKLEGSVDLVRERQGGGYEPADAELAERRSRPDLHSDPALPDDTRLWAALQRVSGGTWGGCVYDVEKILATLKAGEQALGKS